MTNYLDKINQLDFCNEKQRGQIIELVEAVVTSCGGILEDTPSETPNQKMLKEWGGELEMAVACLGQFVQNDPESGCIRRSKFILRHILRTTITAVTIDELKLGKLLHSLLDEFRDIK